MTEQKTAASQTTIISTEGDYYFLHTIDSVEVDLGVVVVRGNDTTKGAQLYSVSTWREVTEAEMIKQYLVDQLAKNATTIDLRQFKK